MKYGNLNEQTTNKNPRNRRSRRENFVHDNPTAATATSAGYEYQIDQLPFHRREKAASMYFQPPNSVRKDINFYLKPSIKKEIEKAIVENANS